MSSRPLKERKNGRLFVERLEDRLVPGEMLTGLLLAPLRMLAVADLVSSDTPTDQTPAAASPADTSATIADPETTATDTDAMIWSPAKEQNVTAATKDDFFSFDMTLSDSVGDSRISGSLSTSASTLLAANAFVDASPTPVISPAPTTFAGSPGTSFGAPVVADTGLASLVTQAAISQSISAGEGAADGAAAEVLVHALRKGHGIRPFAGPGSGPYTPAQIRHAYGFDQLSQDGAGQTIAIVDAYDDPYIVSNLNTFSSTFGLPTTTSGQFTFSKVYAQGRRPRGDYGWGMEISLDVEWAHAIAPRANIMLVEAYSSSFGNLFGAVDYAVNHGAHVVSMSWGANDFAGEASYDSHFNKPGFAFIASSGDTGGVVGYPSASPYVLSVGGTSLSLDASGNLTGPETAWNGSGGGASLYEAQPGYQTSYGLSLGGRGTPDVSYNADPNTGFYVYDTYVYSGWYAVGGTSAGAPQWAALVALANQGRSTPLSTASLTTSPFYTAATGSVYSSNYRDITAGTAGSYTAGPGYDLVTGVGSPLANALVPYLTTL